MGFKENILLKIEIDGLAERIIRSVKDSSDPSRYDKTAMEKLLDIGGYEHVRKRDMDLYLLSKGGERNRIFVLDNGMGIYHTTMDDVLLRKSPTVKEMISIKNAIRILRDSDVLLTKREASVAVIRDECIDRLDLSYDKSDIRAVAKEGADAIDNQDADGVLEALSIFTELLTLRSAPKPFRLSHGLVLGWEKKGADGKSRFGPIVIYDKPHISLKLIEEPISPDDTEHLRFFKEVATGRQSADREGANVFQYLCDRVI